MQTSLLLRLPAELRNCIYEYALTGPNAQLICREVPLRHLPPTHIEEIRGGMIVKRKLKLEERIGIYRMRYPNNGFRLYESAHSEHEAVNLPYVCRQLYLETNNLAQRLNVIVFIDCDNSDLFREYQLARYLQFGPYRDHIRRVILKSSNKQVLTSSQETPPGRQENEARLVNAVQSPFLSLNIIADFCESHPNTLVVNHLAFVHLDNEWVFWVAGLHMMALVRAHVPVHLYGSQARKLYSDIVQPVLQRRQTINMRVGRCTNYRMHPHDEHFDPGTFRRGMESHRLMCDALQDVVGGVETWVNEATRWYEDGF